MSSTGDGTVIPSAPEPQRPARSLARAQVRVVSEAGGHERPRSRWCKGRHTPLSSAGPTPMPAVGGPGSRRAIRVRIPGSSSPLGGPPDSLSRVGASICSSASSSASHIAVAAISSGPTRSSLDTAFDSDHTGPGSPTPITRAERAVDTDRFEAFLRSLAMVSSRRATRRLLPGSAIVGLLGLGARPAEARRRHNPCRGQDTETPCGVGKRCCDGSCVDVLRSPRHCGTCATACADGEECAGGSCCFQTETDAGCTCTPSGGTCGPPPANRPPGAAPPCCRNQQTCTGGLCPCS
jgi:hypothetical protein